jgi:polyisoprenoid-binding protein YceI
MTTDITRIPTGTWVVDPAHSRIGFAVKHLGISTVRGEFKDFEGTLEIGEDVSAWRTYGTVKVASIDTAETDRDGHLRSPDFFDAARFPEIAFESTKIEALDDDEFRVTGRLTIHGVTNEIVLHAEVGGTELDPWGNERVGLEVTGRLSRAQRWSTLLRGRRCSTLIRERAPSRRPRPFCRSIPSPTTPSTQMASRVTTV